MGYNQIMEKLSERIKELRIKNQYSIEQLSKLTNISKSSLCRYENCYFGKIFQSILRLSLGF